MLLDDHTCVVNCPDGKYDNGLGICSVCINPCLTCVLNSTNCLTCITGMFMYQ